jgi:hypothetical protein
MLAHALLVAVAVLGPHEPAEPPQSLSLAAGTLVDPPAEGWVEVSSVAHEERSEPLGDEGDHGTSSKGVAPPMPDEPPAVDRVPAPAPRPAAARPERTHTDKPLAESIRAKKAPDNDGEDWLRVEDQLPEAPAEKRAKGEPTRDPIVERLLAAERRKALADGPRRRTETPTPPTIDETSSASATTPAPTYATNTPGDLAERFTRAVTEAEKANPIWRTRSLGWVGRVRVRLALDDGSLGPPEFEGEPDPVLVRLVEKTLFLLRRGRFALPFSDDANGVQRFEITVRLSLVDDVNRYAYERPTPTRPGRAFFVLPNGRLFEAFVDPNVGKR